VFAVKRSVYCHFNTAEKNDRGKFEYKLQGMLRNKLNGYQRIIVLCIGSDYSVGDCLGSMVGQRLASSCYGGIIVYGTLESPVHAGNLKEVLYIIRRKYYNPFIIAIDSSMGECNAIGSVTLCEGGISPGIALGKTLPKVGDISITGIVIQSGITFEEFIRSVRMRLVIQIVDFIAVGLLNAFDGMNLIHTSL